MNNEITQLANNLKQLLADYTPSNQRKYDFYNADNTVRDFGISTPQKMINTRPGIGWASRAVNTLSDRVVFDGFGNDRVGMNDLLAEINGDKVLNKAKHDAIIAGMSMVAVSNGKLVPFTALECTGEVDETTGLLKWGLAVTAWVKTANTNTTTPNDYLLFTPDWTARFENQQLAEIVPNPTGRTLLVPVTRRATVDRPLGKGKITNTVRRIINEVGRVKRRYEIAGEFYSTPQRYMMGVAEGAEKGDIDASIGRWIVGTKDEDGDKPEIGQLAQMSINQFNDNKKDLARDFCAETSLTLRNLGYETANPTSVESLTALSDDMLLEAKQTQEEIGAQIKNIAITLRMSIDGTNIVSSALRELEPSWKPIFQVDIGASGDAIFKLKEVMPELFETTAGYRMLGLSIRESEALLATRNAPQGFIQGDEL